MYDTQLFYQGRQNEQTIWQMNTDHRNSLGLSEIAVAEFNGGVRILTGSAQISPLNMFLHL